jgi:hypothetical protein
MMKIERAHLVSVLTLTLSLTVSCSDKEVTKPPAKDNKTPAAAKTTDAPKTPDKPAKQEDPSLKAHMAKHFAEIRDIERALVAGDLDKAKKAAAWLAEHEQHDVVEAWEPHIKDMRKTADELARSTSVKQAAEFAAELAGECANCHRDLTAIVTFEWNEVPPKTSDPKAHMLRHQWATDRLWEGLVGPSDDLWSKGASMLAEKPLTGEVITKSKAATLAEQVHELGAKATKVEAQAARVALFSEMLQTCSQCHAMVRGK